MGHPMPVIDFGREDPAYWHQASGFYELLRVKPVSALALVAAGRCLRIGPQVPIARTHTPCIRINSAQIEEQAVGRHHRSQAARCPGPAEAAFRSGRVLVISSSVDEHADPGRVPSPERERRGLVLVIPGHVFEIADPDVVPGAVRHVAPGRVPVIALHIAQHTDREMGRRALHIPMAGVLIVAGKVDQEPTAEPITDALTKDAALVGIITAAIDQDPNPAGQAVPSL
jgi:hypothetical protein